ncbi:MAG TPA: hypothetical protein VJV79_37760 [Polyangiaceae bacterium]|nr:hypothetical protein [Polyangiaceae bacterium]
MILQTLIFLKDPEVTAAFNVATRALDAQAGLLEGPDLNRVAKFLRVSGSAPKFDILSDGQVFHRCRLGDEMTITSIHFLYDSISPLETDENT